ncbi:MOB kinase activator-like 3 isoform X4 [Drosophila willistoni]|uniref:MOB kinase activator-like 3 isoform X4 n=1 Tax=Drosophila willistoni TaxID=7260 RepID=UPI001F07854E|nr:MOB kinase activator-like 3 isoform X4 [Drosophila willistoni]
MSLNGFLEFFHQGRTFRPKKRFTSGTIRYSLHKQAQASLQSGINLRQVVRLPEGEILNDWLAVHALNILESDYHKWKINVNSIKTNALFFTKKRKPCFLPNDSLRGYATPEKKKEGV